MLLEEQKIIPYEPSDLTGRCVLVLAPHPDDESIGCGGALALHAMAGDEIKVVFLTNGAKGDSSGKANKEEYITLRKKEAEEACKTLGIKDIEFWGYEDRGLATSPRVAERIYELLNSYRPELIYLPSPLEYHPDHRAATIHLREALGRIDFACHVAFCEVGAPIGVNCLVDITKTLDKKTSAIQSYKTQLKERPYLDIALSLNRFRSLTLPEGSTHAEGFSLWPSKTVAQLDPLLLTGPRYDRLAASLSDAGPLVSIIVRTKDRPQVLGNALSSIVAQTYSNIEVVLVNDGGEDVEEEAKGIMGEIPLTYIRHQKSLGRAATANSGLKAAEGSFIVFLDDDDIIYPEHVEILVTKLLSTNHKVAYSGVKNVFYEGPTSRPGRRLKEEVVFNHPFDPELLLFENYIPFMSVIFSKDVLSKVEGLSEDMDLFEDWDFLVRLSRHYDFLHVDKVTAEYRFYGADSVGEAHRANYSYDEAVAHAFERFRPYMTGKSWLRFLSGGLVGRLRGDIKALEEQLEKRSESVEGYQRHISELEQMIEDYKAQVTQLEGIVERYRAHPAFRIYRRLKKFISSRNPARGDPI